MTDHEKSLALCVEAAERLAEVLPSSEELTVAGAQAGTEHVVAPFASAVLAETDEGRFALLVAEELLDAVAASELAGLDLAAAVRPAMEAAAAELRLTIAEARVSELELLPGDLGGDFSVVPLIGDGFVAALAVPRPVLAQGLQRRLEPAPDIGAAAGSLDASDAQDHLSRQSDEGSTSAASAPAASSAQATDPKDLDSPDSKAEPPLTRPIYHQGGPVPTQQRRGIELLHGVDMEVTVELGRTRLAVRDLLALSPGAVVELDRAAGAPADLLVNGRLIARGEVVVVDEDFGLRITEIVETRAAG